MKKVKIAAIQMAMTDGGLLADRYKNLQKAQFLAVKAAQNGAQIILLPELFEYPYFCQEKNYEYYSLAETVEESQAVKTMQEVCKKLEVVMPVSFFEKAGNTFFNSVAVIDADGSVLGVYRKTHIPDDQFYQEKFYFSPGDTGFKVFNTKYAKIGVGICWDQWFPETARCMTLMGADILMYPTAIGSEPILNTDSKEHWQRCMQGHSAANIIPVVAANRVGTEAVLPTEANNFQKSALTFYGSSFITDETGKIVEEADRTSEGFIESVADIENCEKLRRDWGIFRDRRPEMYEKILSLS